MNTASPGGMPAKPCLGETLRPGALNIRDSKQTCQFFHWLTK
jgi:hypothetical protein